MFLGGLLRLLTFLVFVSGSFVASGSFTEDTSLFLSTGGTVPYNALFFRLSNDSSAPTFLLTSSQGGLSYYDSTGAPWQLRATTYDLFNYGGYDIRFPSFVSVNHSTLAGGAWFSIPAVSAPGAVVYVSPSTGSTSVSESNGGRQNLFSAAYRTAFAQIGSQSYLMLVLMTDGRLLVYRYYESANGISTWWSQIQIITELSGSVAASDFSVFRDSAGDTYVFLACCSSGVASSPSLLLRYSSITEAFYPHQALWSSTAISSVDSMTYTDESFIVAVSPSGVSSILRLEPETKELVRYMNIGQSTDALRSGRFFVANSTLSLIVAQGPTTGAQPNPIYQWNPETANFTQRSSISLVNAMYWSFYRNSSNANSLVLVASSGQSPTFGFRFFRMTQPENQTVVSIEAKPVLQTPSWETISQQSFGALVNSILDIRTGASQQDQYIAVLADNGISVYRWTGASFSFHRSDAQLMIYGSYRKRRAGFKRIPVSRTVKASGFMDLLIADAVQARSALIDATNGAFVAAVDDINTNFYADITITSDQTTLVVLGAFGTPNTRLYRLLPRDTGALYLDPFSALYSAPATPSIHKFFTVGNKTYLFVGCCSDRAGDSIIYEWLPSFPIMRRFQAIPTSFAYEADTIEIHGETFLLISNGFYNNDPNGFVQIYRWHSDPSEGQIFWLYQTIPGVKTAASIVGIPTWRKAPAFAVASRGTSPSFNDGALLVYSWNGTLFEEAHRMNLVNPIALAAWRQHYCNSSSPYQFLSVSSGVVPSVSVITLRWTDQDLINSSIVEPPINMLSPPTFTAFWKEVSSIGTFAFHVPIRDIAPVKFVSDDRDQFPRTFLWASTPSGVQFQWFDGISIIPYQTASQTGMTYGANDATASTVISPRGLAEGNFTWIWTVFSNGPIGSLHENPSRPISFDSVWEGSFSANNIASGVVNGMPTFAMTLTTGPVQVYRSRFNPVSGQDTLSEDVATISDIPANPGVSAVGFVHTSDNFDFLILGCCQSATGNSRMYIFDPVVDTFQIYDTIPGLGGSVSHIHSFDANGQTYVVFCRALLNPTMTPLIYWWNTASSTLELAYNVSGSPGARSAEAFTIDGVVHVVFAGFRSSAGSAVTNSTVYRFVAGAQGLDVPLLGQSFIQSNASRMWRSFQQKHANKVYEHLISVEDGLLSSDNPSVYRVFRLERPLPAQAQPSPLPLPVFSSNPLPPAISGDSRLQTRATPSGWQKATSWTQLNSWMTNFITYRHNDTAAASQMFAFTASGEVGVLRFDNAANTLTRVSGGSSLLPYGTYSGGRHAFLRNDPQQNTGAWLFLSITNAPGGIVEHPDPFTVISNVDQFVRGQTSAATILTEVANMSVAAVHSGTNQIYIMKYTFNVFRNRREIQDIRQSISLVGVIDMAFVHCPQGSLAGALHSFLVVAPSSASYIRIFKYNVATGVFDPYQKISIDTGALRVVTTTQPDNEVFFAVTSASNVIVYRWDPQALEFYQYSSLGSLITSAHFVNYFSDATFFRLRNRLHLFVANTGSNSAPCPSYLLQLDAAGSWSVVQEWMLNSAFASGAWVNATGTVHLAVSHGSGIQGDPFSMTIFQWVGSIVALSASGVAPRAHTTPRLTLYEVMPLPATEIRFAEVFFASTLQNHLTIASIGQTQQYIWNGCEFSALPAASSWFSYSTWNVEHAVYYRSNSSLGPVDLIATATSNANGALAVISGNSYISTLPDFSGISYSSDMIDFNGYVYFVTLATPGVVRWYRLERNAQSGRIAAVYEDAITISGASTVKYIKIANDHFLFIGCCTNQIGFSRLLRYTPARKAWMPYQSLMLPYVRKLSDVFQYQGETFVVAVNGWWGNYNTPMQVLRWHTNATRGWEFYTYQTLDFLTDCSQPSDARLTLFRGKLTLLVSCYGTSPYSRASFGSVQMLQFNGTLFEVTWKVPAINPPTVNSFRQTVGNRTGVFHVVFGDFTAPGSPRGLFVYRFEGDEDWASAPTAALIGPPQTPARWDLVFNAAVMPGAVPLGITSFFIDADVDSSYIYMSTTVGGTMPRIFGDFVYPGSPLHYWAGTSDSSVSSIMSSTPGAGSGTWVSVGTTTYCGGVYHDYPSGLAVILRCENGLWYNYAYSAFVVHNDEVYLATVTSTNSVRLHRVWKDPANEFDSPNDVLFQFTHPGVQVSAIHLASVSGRLYLLLGCCETSTGNSSLYFVNTVARNYSFVQEWNNDASVRSIFSLPFNGVTYVLPANGNANQLNAPLPVFILNSTGISRRWIFNVTGAQHFAPYQVNGRTFVVVSQTANQRGRRWFGSRVLEVVGEPNGFQDAGRIQTWSAQASTSYWQVIGTRPRLHLAVAQGGDPGMSARISIYRYLDPLPVLNTTIQIAPPRPDYPSAPAAEVLPRIALSSGKELVLDASLFYSIGIAANHLEAFWSPDGTLSLWVSVDGVRVLRYVNTTDSWTLTNVNNYYCSWCDRTNWRTQLIHVPSGNVSGTYVVLANSIAGGANYLNPNGISINVAIHPQLTSSVDSSFDLVNPETLLMFTSFVSGVRVYRARVATVPTVGVPEFDHLVQTITLVGGDPVIRPLRVGAERFLVLSATTTAIFKFNSITEVYTLYQILPSISRAVEMEFVQHQGTTWLFIAIPSTVHIYAWDSATKEFWLYSSLASSYFSNLREIEVAVLDGRLTLFTADVGDASGFKASPWFQLDSLGTWAYVSEFYLRNARSVVVFRDGNGTATVGLAAGVNSYGLFPPSLFFYKFQGSESSLQSVSVRSRPSLPNPGVWRLHQTIPIEDPRHLSVRQNSQLPSNPALFIGTQSGIYEYASNGVQFNLQAQQNQLGSWGQNPIGNIVHLRTSNASHLSEYIVSVYASQWLGSYVLSLASSSNSRVAYDMPAASFHVDMVEYQGEILMAQTESSNTIRIMSLIRTTSTVLHVATVQSITPPTGMAPTPSSSNFFMFGNNLYLLVGCCRSSEGYSFLMRWDPVSRSFSPSQRISTSFLRYFEIFYMNGDVWAAAINGWYGGTSRQVDLYRFHSTELRFWRYAFIDNLDNPSDVHYAWMNNNHHLIVSNLGSAASSYRGFVRFYNWTGTSFEQTLQIDTVKAQSITFWRQSYGERQDNVPFFAYVGGDGSSSFPYTLFIHRLEGAERTAAPPAVTPLSAPAQPLRWVPWQEYTYATSVTANWVESFPGGLLPTDSIWLSTNQGGVIFDSRDGIHFGPPYSTTYNYNYYAEEKMSVARSALPTTGGEGAWLVPCNNAAGAVIFARNGTGLSTRQVQIEGSRSCATRQVGGSVYLANVRGDGVLNVYRYLNNEVNNFESLNDPVFTGTDFSNQATQIELVDTGSSLLLLVGCCTSGRSVQGVRIYTYNSAVDTFLANGTFHANYAPSHFETFRFGGQTYLVVSNGKFSASDPTTIYRWDQAAFNFTLVYSLSNVSAVYQTRSFSLFGALHLLFVSNRDEFGRSSTYSPIFKFVGGSTILAPPDFMPAALPVHAALSATFVEMVAYNGFRIPTIVFSKSYSNNLYQPSIKSFRLEPAPGPQPPPTGSNPASNTTFAPTVPPPTNLRVPAARLLNDSLQFIATYRTSSYVNAIRSFKPASANRTLVVGTANGGYLYRWTGSQFASTFTIINNFGMPWGDRETFECDYVYLNTSSTTSLNTGGFLGCPNSAASGFLRVNDAGVISAGTPSVFSAATVIRFIQVDANRLLVAYRATDGSVSIVAHYIKTHFGLRPEMTDVVGALPGPAGQSSSIDFVNSPFGIFLVSACCRTGISGYHHIYRLNANATAFDRVQFIPASSINLVRLRSFGGALFMVVGSTSTANDGPVVFTWNTTKQEFEPRQRLFSLVVHPATLWVLTDIEFVVVDGALCLLLTNGGDNTNVSPTFLLRFNGTEFVSYKEWWFKRTTSASTFEESGTLYFMFGHGITPSTPDSFSWSLFSWTATHAINAPASPVPALLAIAAPTQWIYYDAISWPVGYYVDYVDAVYLRGTGSAPRLLLSSSLGMAWYSWDRNQFVQYLSGANIMGWGGSAGPFRSRTVRIDSAKLGLSADFTAIGWPSAAGASGYFNATSGAWNVIADPINVRYYSDFTVIDGEIWQASTSSNGINLWQVTRTVTGSLGLAFFLNIPVARVGLPTDVRFFTVRNDTFMLTGCCATSRGWSKLYRYDANEPSRWVSYQRIATQNLVSWELLPLYGEMFLAALNTAGLPIKIYRFHPDQTTGWELYEYQDISSPSCFNPNAMKYIPSFENRPALILSCFGRSPVDGAIKIFTFDGRDFIETHSISAQNPRDVTFFRVGPSNTSIIAYAGGFATNAVPGGIYMLRLQGTEFMRPAPTMSLRGPPVVAASWEPYWDEGYASAITSDTTPFTLKYDPYHYLWSSTNQGAHAYRYEGLDYYLWKSGAQLHPYGANSDSGAVVANVNGLVVGNGTWLSIPMESGYGGPIFNDREGSLSLIHERNTWNYRSSAFGVVNGRLLIAVVDSAGTVRVVKHAVNPSTGYEGFIDGLFTLSFGQPPSVMEFMIVPEGAHLIIGCCTNGRSSSFIYSFNDTTGTNAQVGTFNAGFANSDIKVVKYLNQTYVIACNTGASFWTDPLRIYRWTGSALTQEFELTGVQGVAKIATFVLDDGNLYVAAARTQNSRGRRYIGTNIYRFQVSGTASLVPATVPYVPSWGAVNVDYFSQAVRKRGELPHLVVTHGDSAIPETARAGFRVYRYNKALPPASTSPQQIAVLWTPPLVTVAPPPPAPTLIVPPPDEEIPNYSNISSPPLPPIGAPPPSLGVPIEVPPVSPPVLPAPQSPPQSQPVAAPTQSPTTAPAGSPASGAPNTGTSSPLSSPTTAPSSVPANSPVNGGNAPSSVPTGSQPPQTSQPPSYVQAPIFEYIDPPSSSYWCTLPQPDVRAVCNNDTRRWRIPPDLTIYDPLYLSDTTEIDGSLTLSSNSTIIFPTGLGRVPTLHVKGIVVLDGVLLLNTSGGLDIVNDPYQFILMTYLGRVGNFSGVNLTGLDLRPGENATVDLEYTDTGIIVTIVVVHPACQGPKPDPRSFCDVETGAWTIQTTPGNPYVPPKILRIRGPTRIIGDFVGAPQGTVELRSNNSVLEVTGNFTPSGSVLVLTTTPVVSGEPFPLVKAGGFVGNFGGVFVVVPPNVTTEVVVRHGRPCTIGHETTQSTTSLSILFVYVGCDELAPGSSGIGGGTSVDAAAPPIGLVAGIIVAAVIFIVIAAIVGYHVFKERFSKRESIRVKRALRTSSS